MSSLVPLNRAGHVASKSPRAAAASSKANKGRFSAVRPILLITPLVISGSVLKPAGYNEVLGLDLTAIGFALVVLVGVRQLPKTSRYPIDLLGPILALASLVVWGYVRSESGFYQTAKIRDSVVVLALILILPTLLRNRADLRSMNLMWMCAGCAASVGVLVVGGDASLYGRGGIGGATLGPAYLAAAGTVAAIASLGERHVRWPFGLATICMGVWSLLAVGSRGPAVGVLLVAVAVWMLMGGVSLSKRTLLLVSALIVVAIIGVRLASREALDYITWTGGTSRLELWAIAARAFEAHPIFGTGWGDFSILSPALYPHNVFLEVAAELGAAGLLVFLWLLSRVTSRTRRWGLQGEVRVSAAVFVLWFVGQQFSSDLTLRAFWISLMPLLLLPGVMYPESANALSKVHLEGDTPQIH
jgi:O-antigen ligase